MVNVCIGELFHGKPDWNYTFCMARLFYAFALGRITPTCRYSDFRATWGQGSLARNRDRPPATKSLRVVESKLTRSR